jgi:quercetin dioxygenase-like cupin family protein
VSDAGELPSEADRAEAGTTDALGAGATPPGDAASHFTTEALGERGGIGRYVNVDTLEPVEFVPGLGFRPVVGQRAMTNFVSFQPRTTAPRHVHEEEQIVIVLEGELTFDLDGDVRTMRKGDVAVVPSWVPHAAWTTDSRCLEIDVFCPPRRSLLELAEAHAAGTQAGVAKGPGEPAAGDPDQLPADGQTGGA